VPARLVPVKRPLLALDVAACLEPELPSGVMVHYFGSGPLHDEIVQRAQELGVNAVLHGWVDKWFDECPAGTVVLLPSISEGFGTVLIEASAAGFGSVASSRCLGAFDGISSGITGELTVGGSSADFAAAVLVASRKEEVRGVEAWLESFCVASSGRSLRGALVAAPDRSTASVELGSQLPRTLLHTALTTVREG
jgi:glycosyltransferase involved in cell wall biosynthesis